MRGVDWVLGFDVPKWRIHSHNFVFLARLAQPNCLRAPQETNLTQLPQSGKDRSLGGRERDGRGPQDAHRRRAKEVLARCEARRHLAQALPASCVVEGGAVGVSTKVGEVERSHDARVPLKQSEQY